MKIVEKLLILLNEAPQESALQLKDAIILYFNRMIISVGSGFLPYIKTFIKLLFEKCGEYSFCQIIKLVTLCIMTWKTNGIELSNEMAPHLLEQMLRIGIPTSRISDIEKSQCEAISAYFTLKKTESIQNAIAQFILPEEQYCKLLAYILHFATGRLDEGMRKSAINLITILFATGIGIKVVSENVGLILTQKPEPAAKSPVVNFPKHYEILLSQSKACACACLNSLSPVNAVDMQSLSDLSVLHYLLYIHLGSSFVTLVEEHLSINFKIKQHYFIQEILAKKPNSGSLREYKDLLRKILLEHQKNVSSKH